MNDPASKAAIKRVTNGDHSLEAIAQLLTVMVVCQTSTREDVAEIKATVATLAANYANCPARRRTRRSHVSLGVLAKLTLWCILGLIAILAGVLGVSLPFLK